MSDDRDTRRQTASTLPETTGPGAPQPDAAVNSSYAEIEPAEDTVPYLPPLASYPIEIRITDVRQGVPNICPDEILEEDR